MSEMSQRLLDMIHVKKMSYGELAEKTGIAKSAIQRYATGVTEKIPLPRIELLASALGVSAAYLMGWTDNASAEEESTPVQQDERTGEFIKLFQELDAAHQETLLQVLRGLLAEQKACRDSRK